MAVNKSELLNKLKADMNAADVPGQNIQNLLSEPSRM